MTSLWHSYLLTGEDKPQNTPQVYGLQVSKSSHDYRQKGVTQCLFRLMGKIVD